MSALIDIAANLTHRHFAPDLAEVLHRAERAGVVGMIVTGLSVDVSRRALVIAEARPRALACTAGIHPHNARTFDGESVASLRTLAASERVVAIGECGLDYDRDFSPRAIQQRCFEAQLELAAELGKPVYLHEREAHDDFVRILSRWRPALAGGVVHCFTGRARALEAYLELGLSIGITGWITDPRRGAHLIELVSRIPEERLMIETDAPFLLPSTVRPRPTKGRNEPAFLPHVLRAVAGAAGCSEDAMAERTTRNARRFFALAL